MKTSTALVILVIILFLGFMAWNLFRGPVIPNIDTPITQTPNKNNESAQSSIIGCYIAVNSQDVYTLNIQRQNGEKVSGTLAFNNYQKDSSSGTFNGTYKDGLLLADYAFRSEGMDSVMQVIFKKVGDDFIRGYGQLNNQGNSFSDINNITFDASSPLSVFKKGECPSNKKEQVLSGKYICLPHKDSSGPQTLECALGIETDNGLYAALDFKGLSQVPKIKNGDRIIVKGTLRPVETLENNQWQKYPIIGVFSVTGFLK